jgi:hypothetical protein
LECEHIQEELSIWTQKTIPAELPWPVRLKVSALIMKVEVYNLKQGHLKQHKEPAFAAIAFILTSEEETPFAWHSIHRRSNECVMLCSTQQ